MYVFLSIMYEYRVSKAEQINETSHSCNNIVHYIVHKLTVSALLN